MGHIRTADGKLVCSSCSSSNQVVARRCPYSMCPSIDLCPTCYEVYKDTFSKKAHAQCKKDNAAMLDQRAVAQSLLDHGFYLRRSALGIGNNIVHVIFINKVGSAIGFTMSKNTYHAIDLGTPATDEDFRKHGTLTPAAPDFNYKGA